MNEEILGELRQSVIVGDEDAAKKAATRALESGLDPEEAINKSLAKGMDEIGKKFENSEIFLSDMMMAADAMRAALAVLEPILREKGITQKRGTVVIGTSRGDIHDIGKNIVATMLTAGGYEVHDLGFDVPPLKFVRKAQESNANVIAVSSLLTSSMYYQKDIVNYLKDMGERPKYLVIVGGGAVYPKWVSEIDADGYGKFADDAVAVINSLIEKREQRPLLMEGKKILKEA
jgi:trimethylamine corrinoid protein